MQVFSNLYAKYLKKLSVQELIIDSVNEYVPKSKAELFGESIWTFGIFGGLAAIVSAATGISYLNNVFINSTEVWIPFSIISFLILIIIDLTKKVFTVVYLRGVLSGQDKLTNAFFLGFSLVFTALSFWMSYKGVEEYFAEKNESNALKTVFLVNIDSARTELNKPVLSKKAELQEIQGTAAKLAAQWNPTASKFTEMAAQKQAEIANLEGLNEQKLTSLEFQNQEKINKAQQKQGKKDNQYVYITVFLEIVSLVVVVFIALAKYSIAREQKAVNPDLANATVKPITVPVEMINAEFIQTETNSEKIASLNEQVQYLIQALSGTNSVPNLGNNQANLGFKVGKLGTNLGTNSAPNSGTAYDIWKGTGVTNEVDFRTRYSALLGAISNGQLDSRTLVSAYKVNPYTVAVARFLTEKGN